MKEHGLQYDLVQSFDINHQLKVSEDRRYGLEHAKQFQVLK
jgi:hypothetical protein